MNRRRFVLFFLLGLLSISQPGCVSAYKTKTLFKSMFKNEKNMKKTMAKMDKSLAQQERILSGLKRHGANMSEAPYKDLLEQKTIMQGAKKDYTDSYYRFSNLSRKIRKSAADADIIRADSPEGEEITEHVEDMRKEQGPLKEATLKFSKASQRFGRIAKNNSIMELKTNKVLGQTRSQLSKLEKQVAEVTKQVKLSQNNIKSSNMKGKKATKARQTLTELGKIISDVKLKRTEAEKLVDQLEIKVAGQKTVIMGPNTPGHKATMGLKAKASEIQALGQRYNELVEELKSSH